MILGSGLGVMADEVENPTVIRYETFLIFLFPPWKDMPENWSLAPSAAKGLS
jgi:hypothetical protein